ncbi:NADH-flavin reductase [Secundilactobacillus pentosiphilus]|uniref:NADH-flavin reductase n=1 Tax=Secundilactobacillus pentosiphilus TaxID=1714682 RepID=A0A1Z5ITT5_9LACO|nr:NAD(P)H-binding protein [Secundilactobacillus pentosiphilus]GAX05012.1 NADH-flavin reductase [Secundilactobacillus pentosiphilus]
MKIGIIGATGHVGQAVYKEAVANNIDATAIVRDAKKAQSLLGADAQIVEKDALALTYDDLKGFDYVVDAFASLKAYQHIDMATNLITMFRENTVTKLVFIIGASTLLDDDGKPMIDTVLKKYAGQPWIEAPVQQSHEFEYLKWVDNVDWIAVTPQNELNDGPKTNFKIGGDHPMVNQEGKPVTSTGNLAAAIVQEMKEPKHIKQRFSVVDA